MAFHAKDGVVSSCGRQDGSKYEGKYGKKHDGDLHNDDGKNLYVLLVEKSIAK